jgi:tripartite ATP-independent transporter DctP family solute receptor
MLGNEREIVQQVQQGICDLMASGTAIWGSVAPKFQILDLPFLFRDYDHIHKAMDGEPGQLLAKYVEEKAGARPIAYMDSFGFRSVVTRTKEVKNIDDMKGLKIRTIQSPIYVKAVELMGASPTPMSFGEVYTSLQTGVIDGYEHDANTTLAQKFFEVTKFMALTEHISGVLGLTASPKSLDSLPPDLKKAVLEAAKEAAAFQRARAPEEDKLSLADLKKKGMVINAVDRKPFMAKAEPFWTSFSKEVQAEDLTKKIAAL